MEKHEKIIQLLLNNQWVTSSEISKFTEIPTRTLQRSISDINNQYPELIFSGRKGYKINMENYQNYSVLIDKNENRSQSIINSLVFSESPLIIEDLEEKLFISTSTLKKELIIVKKILANYNLSLIVSCDSISLQGIEKSKRKLIRDYIYGEVDAGFINLSMLQQYFPAYDTEEINRVLATEFASHELYADDYTLYNLTLHILIKMERTKTKNILINNSKSISTNTIFQAVSKSICLKFSQIYAIAFSDHEIYEFGILISSCTRYHQQLSQDEKNIQKLVSKSTYNLTKEIIHSVNENYGLNLSSQSFLDNFSLHMKNLLVRLEHHITIKNPLLKKLKTSYPFIYELSVFIANLIEKHTYNRLSEDEIAYIALHLGSQVEVTQSLTTKIICVLLSPEFYSLNQTLLNSLHARYDKEMIITNVLTSPSQLPQTDSAYDLIISTVPLESKYLEKAIIIDILIDSFDYKKLDFRIDEVCKQKFMFHFKHEIQKLFSKNHFIVMDRIMESESIIKTLATALYEDGYVPNTFTEACLKREMISPTAYSALAIPHPVELMANKSVIAVAINKQHFIWSNGKKVKLIMMLAIHRQALPSFKFIFEFISHYANDNINIQNIISSDTFLSFEVNFDTCLNDILLHSNP